MKRVAFLCCALNGLLLASVFAVGAPYQLHVLDAPPGQLYSAAYKINDQGTIVGFAAANYASRNSAEVYSWNGLGVHCEGLPQGNSSIVGLNNSGAIVRGDLLSSGGTSTTLPNLFPTYGNNSLMDVNDAGIVVGDSYGPLDNSGGHNHAALWDSTGVHDLGALPGCLEAEAYGINDLGQIVGQSWNETGPWQPGRGILWDHGSKTQLDPLDGYDQCGAFGINNRGQILGASTKEAYYYYGGTQFTYYRYESMLWSNGATIDIAADGMDTYACDINYLGQVVGYASPYPNYQYEKAFVWQDGTMTWLDGLGGPVTEALGINSNGWIVGRAKGLDGNYHAVEWVPVPEPPALCSLFVSSVGGAYYLRRRKRRK